MSATRLTKVVRRIVETDAGPLTVLLKPGRNGRHAVVEVRVKRGRRVLQTLTLHHPHEPLE